MHSGLERGWLPLQNFLNETALVGGYLVPPLVPNWHSEPVHSFSGRGVCRPSIEAQEVLILTCERCVLTHAFHNPVDRYSVLFQFPAPQVKQAGGRHLTGCVVIRDPVTLEIPVVNQRLV